MYLPRTRIAVIFSLVALGAVGCGGATSGSSSPRRPSASDAKASKPSAEAACVSQWNVKANLPLRREMNFAGLHDAGEQARTWPLKVLIYAGPTIKDAAIGSAVDPALANRDVRSGDCLIVTKGGEAFALTDGGFIPTAATRYSEYAYGLRDDDTNGVAVLGPLALSSPVSTDPRAGTVLLAAPASAAAATSSGTTDPTQTFPPGVAVRVAGVAIEQGEVAHWVRISRASDPGSTQRQSITFLIRSQWLEAEAKRQSITVSDSDVMNDFSAARKRAFSTTSDYLRFLRKTGQTQADMLVRQRAKLLERRIQARVQPGIADPSSAAMRHFGKTYVRRWRAQTYCGPRYVMSDCSNASPRQP